MKKLQMMILPLLLTTMAASAQDGDSAYSEFGAYFGSNIDILENSTDQKNISLTIQAMVFPDVNRVKQFSFYFGGGGSVANTNGVTDTAQTVFGEFGVQTKYVTPYVNLFFTREQSGFSSGDVSSDVDDDDVVDCTIDPDACDGGEPIEPSDLVNLYYGSGFRFGLGILVNSPISDNFSAKISSILSDDLAVDARVFYRIPVRGEAKPVFSVGYKRVVADNKSGEGLRDGDGFSVSIGVSRRL